MIEVTQSIDQEARTITWKLDETEPEHDIDGIMCHAVDEAVDSPELRHQLFMLGYDLIKVDVSKRYMGFPGRSLTFYWAKRS